MQQFLDSFLEEVGLGATSIYLLIIDVLIFDSTYDSSNMLTLCKFGLTYQSKYVFHVAKNVPKKSNRLIFLSPITASEYEKRTSLLIPKNCQENVGFRKIIIIDTNILSKY